MWRVFRISLISGFRPGVYEISAFLKCYLALIRSLSIKQSGLLDPWRGDWYVAPKRRGLTSYQSTLRNITVDLIFRVAEELLISQQGISKTEIFNPLKPELNPICYLLALLGVHHFLHVSRIRVKSLTFRLLMSYIYGAPILDVSRSHTTTQHSR